MRLKAVLFDFDDTLFDHQHAYQTALQTLYDVLEVLQTKTYNLLEAEYVKCLEDFHTLTIQGKHALEEIRLLRMQSIFKTYGISLDDKAAFEWDAIYRKAYLDAQREVPGSSALLAALKAKGYQIGVVTNHVAAEQEGKILELGLESYIDTLICAHDHGITKPDPQVFEMALNDLNVEVNEVVMVGDAWHSDIEGAYALGIRAIWLNRYGHAYPDANKAVQITKLLPTEDILALIVNEHSR